MTPTELDARIKEIKDNENYTFQEKRDIIQNLLDEDAASLEPGNLLAIVHAAVFGLILMLILSL